MKSFALTFVIASMLSSCLVNCVVYKDCGSISGKFTKISVSECDETKAFCILKRGTDATIGIEFELNTEIENNVTAVCHGKVSGLSVPFKIPNPDGCVDSNLECPLTQGKTYQYKASFPVLKVYPRVNVEVKYELKDDDGKDIVCVTIPVKIQ